MRGGEASNGQCGGSGSALSALPETRQARVHQVGQCPEFIAENFHTWLTKVGIKPIRIYPGSPWENGYNERFNGTLRREVLNAEWFTSIRQAQVVIETWLKQYNHIRPHQALNMRPPVPETLSGNGT